VNGIWNYFRGDQAEILRWTWTTVWLAALALAIGLAVSLPIGYLAYRYRFTYPPLVGLASLIYTIPSFVVFVTLPGILHTDLLDPKNVLVALSLYTVALLVRVVADGLASVSPATLDAASAMGLTNLQRLFRVQLPMAVPVIGAGLRVAAVSNVSLVSVASLIGVAQLGQLFTIFSEGNAGSDPVFVGLILIVGVALVFDAVILVGIRLATPWQRAAR
jgi:osmoprotectant transport system permease protein